MRLARLLGKLRGPCLRVQFSRVRERRNLLGVPVNDSPNEFHTLPYWQGLSGAGRLSNICFRFLVLDVYRSFLGHPFNSFLIRQSLHHGIIHFLESPDRKSCVPILQAVLYQICRGRANPFSQLPGRRRGTSSKSDYPLLFVAGEGWQGRVAFEAGGPCDVRFTICHLRLACFVSPLH
jgi:hypothetical protein